MHTLYKPLDLSKYASLPQYFSPGGSQTSLLWTLLADHFNIMCRPALYSLKGHCFLINTQISLRGRSDWRPWLWSGSPRRWECDPQSLCLRSRSSLSSPHHLSETKCPRSAGFLLCTLSPPDHTRVHKTWKISGKNALRHFHTPRYPHVKCAKEQIHHI